MLEMRSSLKLNPALRVLLIALPVLCFFVCLGIGRMTIPPGEVLRAVLAGAGAGGAVPAQIRNVVWSMRMPRLILASLVGAGLSVSGCAFQGLFSNPLATSDTLGVASGASFGAVLALLLGCAVTVNLAKSLLQAVIIFMAYSSVMCLLWILMESPDLAITEAAVGAGVSGMLFLLTLKKLHQIGGKDGEEL